MISNGNSSISLTPPECVRGMKKLDKSKFSKYISVPTLCIPGTEISNLMKVIKKKSFKAPGIKALVESDNDQQVRILLLNPNIVEDKFNEEQIQALEKCGVSQELGTRELQLKYENYNHSEVLRAILPEKTDGVTAFTAVGHILHLNLKQDVTQYQNIIGEVLLDKIKYAKTVVNKINTIDNEFRNFQMEVIAGESNFVTSVKENGLTFRFDFSKVYWNSRLGTEHQRVVDQLTKDRTLYDVFAGVGPFAVPASKRGFRVLANDLNPSSYSAINDNLKLNKVKSIGSLVKTYNMDGRDFIAKILAEDMRTAKHTVAPLVVMNLPGLAIDFLDAFVGLFSENEDFQDMKMPEVNCYCFESAESDQQMKDNCIQRTMKSLSLDTIDNLPDISARVVRNVAPNKNMLCVSFHLTEQILRTSNTEQPPLKKVKSSQENIVN